MKRLVLNFSFGALNLPQNLPAAAFMYWPQISAGNVPPSTLAPWNSGPIGMRPCGKPTQVDVASRGEKPTNQASEFLSVVPVLPPTGQPVLARPPVPGRLMFISRIFTISYIAAESKTFLRLGLDRSSVLPPGKRTSVIALGVLRQPPLTIVA